MPRTVKKTAKKSPRSRAKKTVKRAAPAPKRSATARRAPPAKRAAPKRAAPKAARPAQLPDLSRAVRLAPRAESALFTKSLRAAPKPRETLSWLLAGTALLYMIFRRSSPAQAQALPTTPAAPVTPPPSLPSPTPPAKPVPPTNALTPQQIFDRDFRRATTAEIPRDILVQAGSFLKFPMGSAHVIKAEDGREFAAVLEEHFHSPESGLKPVGKHKGVSMFIKRTP